MKLLSRFLPLVFPPEVFGVILSLGRQKGKFVPGYLMQVLQNGARQIKMTNLPLYFGTLDTSVHKDTPFCFLTHFLFLIVDARPD